MNYMNPCTETGGLLYGNNIIHTHGHERFLSAYIKEPETIYWISQFKDDSVFYDIGANVGLYSLIAGSKGCKVYSFEPESKNFTLLNGNIQLNSYDITAYCLAVYDKFLVDKLYCSNLDSYHNFKSKSKYQETKFTQGCISLSLQQITEYLPSPNHIKIDVDGIEKTIVDGYDKFDELDSMLIEVNEDDEKEYIRERLSKYGFICTQIGDNMIFHRSSFDNKILLDLENINVLQRIELGKKIFELSNE